jgi:hypothetical protein
MIKNEFYKYPAPKPAGPSLSSVPASEDQTAVDYVPSSAEVANRAYFNYVNEGSLHGRDVQHWLHAEEELTKGCNFTRAHGFHN